MNHSDLVRRADKWLKSQGWKVVINDNFRAYVHNGEQPDVIAWRDGVSILIECKVSRADFLKDKKKRFRQESSKGMGNWRFYFCPPGIIEVDDLPYGWGLLWANPKTIKKVHGYPSNCHWHFKKPFQACLASENMMLVSALRRFAVRGKFDTIYEKVE